MAPRMSWNLHLNPHTTQINTRLVHLDAVAIYRYQNRTHSTSILGPSFLELTPQVLESQARCQCYVSDKLVTMSIDPYSIDWFAPQIASYAIAAASRVGDDDGFYLIAKLEIIMDDYYPLDIPIPMYGADYSTHGIDEHIWLQDEPIWLHDGDGGVIVLDAVEEDDMHMDMIRPRGASKSVIDKLIRKGRLADNDDVKGTCPVCLDDFVHRRTATEMLRMPCSHLFHHHCIVPWLQKNDSCPMCRKSVAV